MGSNIILICSNARLVHSNVNPIPSNANLIRSNANLTHKNDYLTGENDYLTGADNSLTEVNSNLTRANSDRIRMNVNLTDSKIVQTLLNDNLTGKKNIQVKLNNIRICAKIARGHSKNVNFRSKARTNVGKLIIRCKRNHSGTISYLHTFNFHHTGVLFVGKAGCFSQNFICCTSSVCSANILFASWIILKSLPFLIS